MAPKKAGRAPRKGSAKAAPKQKPGQKTPAKSFSTVFVELPGGNPNRQLVEAGPAESDDMVQAKKKRLRRWSTDDAVDRVVSTKLSGYAQHELDTIVGRTTGSI